MQSQRELAISRAFIARKRTTPQQSGAATRKFHALIEISDPREWRPSQFIFAAEAEDRNAGKTLSAFFEAEWDYALEQNPTMASSLADRRWNDRWPDRSLDAIRKREEHATDAAARLMKMIARNFSAADQ